MKWLAAFLLVTAPLMAQRVTVYPISSSVHEFTGMYNGSSKVLSKYSAIVVLSNHMDKFYAIHCTTRWIWDHCHQLLASDYEGTLKGSQLTLWAQWDGNQHKKYAERFVVDDIQQLPEAFADQNAITAFKQSDQFKKRLPTD